LLLISIVYDNTRVKIGSVDWGRGCGV
jgi:hypothetical protein